MAKKIKARGLGRGLATLLGDDVNFTDLNKSEESVVELPVEQLQAGQYQPRNKMEEEKLRELADSIREQGLISPITVRRLGDKRYEIIAGERRYRASCLLGKKTIAAIVKKVDDKGALAMALIENIQRENLNVIEVATGINRLIEEFDYTHEQAAAAVGKSRSATTNLLRLLTLAEPVQTMLKDGQLEMGHARALLTLPKIEQIQLSSVVIANKLSVRETEKLVETQKGNQKKRSGKKASSKSGDDLILENRLSEALGATVHIQIARGGKGKIVIDFPTLDDLDSLIAKIAPEG